MDHHPNSSFPSFMSHRQEFVRNGHLPEAQGAPPLDRRSRPMGTGMNFERPYPLSPRPGPGPGPGPGLSFGLSESHGPGIQTPYQMQQFLRSDGPWAVVSGQPPSQAMGGSIFSTYRTGRVTSEYGIGVGPGILPSDSGYDSMARQSVANPSVVGEPDRSPDGFGLSLPNFANPHGANQGSLEYRRETWSQPSTTGPPDSFATSPTAGRLVCTDCNKPLKTKSELKKHKARHSKPHSCKRPDCKSNGFATANDLDRHQKSVHDAPGPRYRCRHNDKCRNKAKAWPRADNFKEHLKRIHKLDIGRDFDLTPYKWEDPGSENPVLASIGVAPEQNPTFDPANLRIETNDGMFQNDSADGGDPFSSEIELSFASHVNSAVEPNFDEPTITNTNLPGGADEPLKEMAGYGHRDSEVLAEEAEFDAKDPMSIDSEVDDQTISQLYEPAMHSEHGIRPDGDMELTDHPPPLDVPPGPGTGPQEPVHGERSGSLDKLKSAIDITKEIDPSNVAEASAFIKRLEDKGLLQTLMEKHGYQKAKELSMEPSPTAISSPSPASKPSPSRKMVKCTYKNCGKSFPRKCELKKHMKRHLKPYGCTFPDCNGLFGSKNDWKRHENSQHLQLDIWCCDEKPKNTPGSECAKFYHRRESFKNHLKKCHSIHDSKTLDDKMNNCRTDGNRQTQFWCGFCRTIITPNNQNGLFAWNERYNHIEAHLQGRGCEKQHMSEWKYGEEDSPETDSLAPGLVDGGGESSPETTRGDAAAATDTAGDLAILQASLLGSKRAGEGDNPASPASKRARESGNPSSRRLRNGDSPIPEWAGDNDGPPALWLCCECNNFMACEAYDSCFNCEGHHKRCDNCRTGYGLEEG